MAKIKEFLIPSRKLTVSLISSKMDMGSSTVTVSTYDNKIILLKDAVKYSLQKKNRNGRLVNLGSVVTDSKTPPNSILNYYNEDLNDAKDYYGIENVVELSATSRGIGSTSTSGTGK